MPDHRGELRASGRRFAIVVSRFNDAITDRLVAGARACLAEHGARAEDIDVISVPGAWELPIAADLAARAGRPDAIIALGCVIRGETPHFDYVAGPAAHGLSRVALDHGIPVALGLLTTEDAAQALERAGGRHGNKGRDAALAAIELADLAGALHVARANP
ncbi:MAG: 6,7-dimethyl-8-ribityllumazine synthase [Gemmatimonadetes bacterium]|nr:6,7-dimethyl-8-ribityllumazine synthase [Gemmatimonadota bacterium]